MSSKAISPEKISKAIPIPQYISKFYWWAYTDPPSMKFWDHPFVVNFILYGNYNMLRTKAAEALCSSNNSIQGSTLQISCAYGDMTEQVVRRMGEDSSLQIIDVVPAQLTFTESKLRQNFGDEINSEKIKFKIEDATNLSFSSDSYDQVLVYLLIHELPTDAKRLVLSEAVRVLKPGGKLVCVEFHPPKRFQIVQLWTRLVFWMFEPFAKEMLHFQLTEWMPKHAKFLRVEKMTFFGNLFQRVIFVKRNA